MCRGTGGYPHFHTIVGWEGGIELFVLFIDVETRDNYKDTTAKVSPSWVCNRTDALPALWLYFTEIVPSWSVCCMVIVQCHYVH